MKIVYFGSRALGDSHHDLVAVFTQPARPAGRHKTPQPTPVARWAAENSVPCTEAGDINSPENIAAVAACRADLLVVIAFGQKISRSLIDLHPKGAINVHASLLPRYRGAAPINAAIIQGETETGISIITLADRMDAGFILAQAKTGISPDDTAESLHDRLAELSPPLLLETIDQIAAGTAVYTAQDESQVSFARKLKKSDGFIDWSRPAEEIANRTRGLWPWPGAQTDYVSARTSKCCRVTIANASPLPEAGSQPGTYGMLDQDLNVICGRGRLKILRIKPAGSALMDFKDFVNGRATRPGDLFMPVEKGL